MDEQNKYLEDTKTLIERKSQLKDLSNCEALIKDVKEECILYENVPNYVEDNRDETYTNFSDINQTKLSLLLNEISSLSSKEKLLLYFKIPGGITETDPLRQHQNPLGTRLEINRTINWIKSHLEHDPEVSIPKQDVYNDYSVFCRNCNIKPLSTADFGKVMKQVFPDVKPRRLGTRGNSRYCYAAMRKVTKLTPPHISVADNSIQRAEIFEEIDKDSWSTIKKWTEEVMHVSFSSIKDLAVHIKKNNLNSLNPSKIILQRKYMQRYNNKKKFSDVNIKRKKKRKRKNSSNIDIALPACISPSTLKVEEFSDSNNSYNSSVVLTPMNLAMESTDFQKSNQSSVFRDTEINNSIEDNSLTSASICSKNLNTSAELNIFQTKIKKSQNENLQITSNNVVPELISDKISSNSNQNLLQRNEDNSLMGPPQVQANSELYANNLSLRKRQILEASMNRNKGLPSGNVNENDNVNDDKDTLLQDFLPRERVISICNMDKHELDDYLPNIENPDEQDAELLQYFQTPEPVTTAAKTEENNQLPNENKNENPSITAMYTDNNLPQSKLLSQQSFVTNKNASLLLKNKSELHGTGGFPYDKSTSTLIYPRENETLTNIYSMPNMEQRNFRIAQQYCTTNSRNRYNFVPISTKGNSSVNVRPAMNLSNTYPEYNSKIYNPTISASAPTSPNILRQKNLPIYPFEFVEKYDSFHHQNLMDSALKVNSNDNLEFRSRSVPLNGPKIEEFDHSEYVSDCNSVAQTPIPHEFNDFNEQLSLLNGPETLDVSVNPLNTSQQNIYIPQINNDLQNMSKKIYDNLAQKYANIKSTISRSNPTTPLPLMTIQKTIAINNFEINSIKESSKMFDLSKSMPTTPIESEINMFRYSPDNKSNNLMGVGSGVNRIDSKKRKNLLIFNQFKDSNHSNVGINQATNLENSLNSFDGDPNAEILKNL